jgi:hypothetical protein
MRSLDCQMWGARNARYVPYFPLILEMSCFLETIGDEIVQRLVWSLELVARLWSIGRSLATLGNVTCGAASASRLDLHWRNKTLWLVLLIQSFLEEG